jgi:pimeloyl-ACP methyl ester carboxylesterase
MPAVHVTTWQDTADPLGRVVLVHGVMTWGTDDVSGFAAQRPLAARYRLDLVDRRGYGGSPDIDHSDCTVDAADVITVLLDDGTPGGTHLVGHSFGGVVALLVAAERPDLVASLALIEPAAYQATLDSPLVAKALARQRAGLASLPADFTPAQFLEASSVGIDAAVPERTPQRLRAAGTAMREHPCTEVSVDLSAIAGLTVPKLVVRGDWTTAPEVYRELGGRALMACADLVSERIGADLQVVAGADHSPHVQQPVRVNALLAALWDRSAVR